MKNISEHKGILRIIGRLNNSINGNPRYLCYVEETGALHGVSFYTGVDSQHGYGITNYRDKPVKVTIGTHYGKPTLNSIE